MKKIILILVVLGIHLLSFAQEDKSLSAFLSYGTFTVPGEESYIETYLAVDAYSVVFSPVEDDKFQANIEVTIIFSQNDTVRNFAKYLLHSPLVDSPEETNFGILDQQRFSLEDGEYIMEVEISDLNNKEAPSFSTEELITLDFNKNEIQVSAIQLLERYTPTKTPSIISKNGYDLIPMVYAFFPTSVSKLQFYTEIYYSDLILGEENRFLVTYYIESYENLSLMNGFLFRKRMEARPVNVLMSSIDISKLPSGNYYLTVEVRNQTNEILTTNKIFFQRSNPAVEHQLTDISSINTDNTFVRYYQDTDTLAMYLNCIGPIASEAERDYAHNLALTGDLQTMQRFFFNFWQKRNHSNPEKEWLDYFEEVKKVNYTYKTISKPGYASDRGRVYLKYGAPDQMAESHSEPGAYPYEIWHYYSLGTQRNKRFVFVTKDIVTNDFVLVHSDAIGELANYRWQLDIYKRTWDPNSIDQTGPEDTFGNRALDFYTNPR